MTEDAEVKGLPIGVRTRADLRAVADVLGRRPVPLPEEIR